MDDWAMDAGASYRKVEVSRPRKGSEEETPEHKFWRRFKTTASHKAYAAVHCVTYSPVAPHDFAATNSTRVQIYGARGKAVKRTVSRFKDVVYCASFRRDGKLLVASGEETDLKVFDATNGGMLRLMRGHTKAVHACGFSDDKLHVVSGSDDATVRLWDVATGEATLTMTGHTDHVRSLAPSPASPEIWASGSYDHTVKLWDCRTGKSVASVDHGQPVQASLILPGGGVLVTAGGNVMKVWDILAGGRLLQSVSNHSKPITCLAMDAEGGRVLSGSLDHHLKVYDVGEFRVRYSFDYTQPILSCAVSPEAGTVAVGMASGLLTVRARNIKGAGERAQVVARRAPRAGTYHYFVRGQRDSAAEDDFRVEHVRKARLAPYDKMLKAFHYGAALDAALATAQPQVVVSVLHELTLRDALRIALSGRDEESVLPILRFLCKYMADQAFASLLCDCGHVLLELYATVLGRAPEVDEMFWKLRWRVHEVLALDAELLRLQGSLELILAASVHSPSAVD